MKREGFGHSSPKVRFFIHVKCVLKPPRLALVDSNTLNIPLNDIALGDNDYVSIMSTAILPLIHSWKPEVIFVSCG